MKGLKKKMAALTAAALCLTSMPLDGVQIVSAATSVDSTVKLMDGKSPLEMELPGPLNMLKKPLLKKLKGTVIEKVLRDHDVIRDGMI